MSGKSSTTFTTTTPRRRQSKSERDTLCKTTNRKDAVKAASTEWILNGVYDDGVSTWCKARKKIGLCWNADEEVQGRYGILAAHVQQKYSKKPQQVREWFDDADGWPIAHAFAEEPSVIVVTEEYEKSTYKSKIKIPTLCRVFDIQCINTAQLLRVLKADFSKGS
jgi:hypothetical protein